ncbi:fliH protein [Clostridium botulinum]|uniref:FliH protein n=1 Tax=Clostridium botulinum TaxID=1491 RepID=A0A9Q1ZDF1_CLOBO|nr:fliH protein [Clostridium botulinum]AEB75811.1 putative fliH protein [Clostridium botulinum BKT015925]KEH98601.1 fliH protein [Clostridium botulinum D str. 16868]KEI05735.1 fliH protein [Clostridium botulinum C/D str. Sp77]KLU75642.1 fliH protein [Clostridium botulinum V891]KOA75285.1 fliH protein [Clostridium botulinum]
MPSLCNVIKNNSVISNGLKEINTEYHIEDTKDEKVEEEKKELGEKNAKDFIENYEVLARTMLENARKQSDAIVASAYDEIQKMQEEAYNKGYEEGKLDGYSDGKKQADEYYDDIKNKATEEIEVLNKNADELLFSAKNEYVKYLQDKQQKIKELIVHITKSILKSEVENSDAINSMILDALETAKDSKSIIVKCNNKYIDNLKESIDKWKIQVVFRGEIFIVPDDNLGEGKAIIQKENGKIVIDVDIALEKINEIVLMED